jgi:hypothetical protein
MVKKATQNAKNYYHLKPRCVKCAGDHLTNQCHRKETSSDVRCVLCGGNHPTNYKGCTVSNGGHSVGIVRSRTQAMEYGLQGPTKENIPTSTFEKIHCSCTNQTNIIHSTTSNIRSNNPKKNFVTNIEQDPHTNRRGKN